MQLLLQLHGRNHGPIDWDVLRIKESLIWFFFLGNVDS